MPPTKPLLGKAGRASALHVCTERAACFAAGFGMVAGAAACDAIALADLVNVAVAGAGATAAAVALGASRRVLNGAGGGPPAGGGSWHAPTSTVALC